MENGGNGFDEWEREIADGCVNAEALVRAVLAEVAIDFDWYVDIQVELERRLALSNAGSEARVSALKMEVVNDVLGMLRKGQLDLDFLMPGKNGTGKPSGHRSKDRRLVDRRRGLKFRPVFAAMKGGRTLLDKKRGNSAAARLEKLFES